jgi:uncharacterized protein (UPF0335 family)
MLSTDTTHKLDLLVKALEQGKLDDIIRKVEFVDNLKGDTSEGEFAALNKRIEDLRQELANMTQNYMEIKADMTYMAQAIRAVLELNKKLDWNKSNIENVCSKYHAY